MQHTQPGMTRGYGMTRKRTLPGDALRDSGLPLEFAVSQALTGIKGVLPKGRYFYERDGTTCETDLWALHRWEGRTSGRNDEINHVLFLECEHRAPSKNWCFFPQAKNVVDRSKNAIFSGFIPSTRPLDKSRLRPLEKEFFTDVPIVGDGIELFEGGSGQWSHNSPAIRNAIRQATMPIGDMLSMVFFASSGCDWKKTAALYFFTPVIVTTARIQVLKPDVGWKDLSRCANIDECFEEKNSVCSVFTTPSYIQGYWRDSFERGLKRAPSDFTIDAICEFGDPSDDFVTYEITESAVDGKPTRVLVVELDSLNEVIGKYLGVVKEEIETCMGR